MVVILAAPRAPIGVWHERIATPSACTVQAPHWAMPQPYLVPVMPSSSRRTHNKGVSAADETVTALPLIRTVRAIVPPRRGRNSRLVPMRGIASVASMTQSR